MASTINPVFQNLAYAAQSAGFAAPYSIAVGDAIDTFVMMASGDQRPTRPMRVKKRSEIVPASQIPDPKQPGFWKRVGKRLAPAEIKWRLLAKGHTRPRKIYKSSEAAERRVGDAEFKFISNFLPSRLALNLEDKNIEHREATKEMKEYAKVASLAEGFLERALSWMDADYVGETVRARLDRSRPVLVTYVGCPVGKYYISGAYHIGTNCIHIDFVRFEKNRDKGTRIVQVAHELHHYASWLGGGMKVRWRDREGKPRFKKRPPRSGVYVNFKNERLNDVLTTILSHQLVKDHGIEITDPSNPEELILGLMLQELTDKDDLRRAYFSGDYTAVAHRLDDRLGEGTFEKMLEKLGDGPYGIWGALSFIYDMINKRKLEAKGYWSQGLGKKIIDGSIIDGKKYFSRFIPHQYRKE